MADYYDLLGVARDADPDTLKRAYRRLARQYHPDVNKDPGAEDRFKEIGRAYEVLSDPQTRGRYDQFGEAGLGGGGGMPDMGDMGGFADLFETFFSGFGGAAPGQGPRRRGPNQGDDLRLDFTISFQEAVFGIEKEVQIRHLETCDTCKGTGAKQGSGPTTCGTCGGSGQVRRATRTPFGANMRVLDLIAAGRWLRDVHGTDSTQTFVWGDSQGGWTVLRAFTDDPFIRTQMQSLYRGGIAAYPNCFSNGTMYEPTLSPYFAPVIVFTGGKDTATPISQCPERVLKSAAQWIHYSDQTHGWDTANRGASGMPVDGECGKAMNVYNHFLVCRSNRTTEDMRNRIRTFVQDLTGS